MNDAGKKDTAGGRIPRALPDFSRNANQAGPQHPALSVCL